MAFNRISCKKHYRQRFEELFACRKGAIDAMPGFELMEVPRPNDGRLFNGEPLEQ